MRAEVLFGKLDNSLQDFLQRASGGWDASQDRFGAPISHLLSNSFRSQTRERERAIRIEFVAESFLLMRVRSRSRSGAARLGHGGGGRGGRAVGQAQPHRSLLQLLWSTACCRPSFELSGSLSLHRLLVATIRRQSSPPE